MKFSEGNIRNFFNMFWISALIIAMALFFASCSSSDAPVTSSNTTTPGSDNRETSAVCEAGDPNQASPIYGHQVFITYSPDGYQFTPDHVMILDHASVPEGFIGPDGKLWVFFVNGEPGKHGIFAARQTDDGSWVITDCVKIDHAFNGNAVDPDVVKLPDGRYRLFYFLGNFVTPPDPGQDNDHPIYSAISSDGLNFTTEQMVISVPGVTDPSVVLLKDGTWLMAMTNGTRILLATSTDGKQFQLTGVEITLPGIPELAVMADGSVRLYLSKSLLSTDGGRTWFQEAEHYVPGPDPSLVLQADGTYVMLYKQFK